MEMFEIADELVRLKDIKEEQSAALKETNALIMQLESDLAEAFIENEIDGFKRGGRTFFPTTKVFVRPNKDRVPDLHDWLARNGYEYLIESKVNTNTLRSAIKEIIDTAGDVPTDLAPLIIIDEVPTVGVRRT